MTFNLCLIGSGRVSEAHIAATADLARRVRIASVVDVDAEAAHRTAARLDAEAYTRFDAAAADPDWARATHGVLICTPPSQRVPLVDRALAYGKPVLMEKPIAHRLTDARRLVELAEAHPDRPCHVGFCHRFTPAIERMIELAHDGRLGRIVRFENVFAASIDGMDRHWMSDPAVSGGGSLLDTGLHALDLFQYLLGEPELVGATLHHAWPGRGDSNASLLVRATGRGTAGSPRIAEATGVAGVILTGWAEASRFEVRLVGTRATAEYDFDHPRTLRLTNTDGTAEDLPVDTHEGRFTRQLEAFLDAATGKGKAQATRACSFAEALPPMKIVTQAMRQDAQTPATPEPTILKTQSPRPASRAAASGTTR